ncbi:MAG: DNA replication/repair protein RecF [Dongiaceae bacterium]
MARLHLQNFRNYEALELEISFRPIVLTGPNGAGKTNLLEAISFLSPGRGLRSANLREIDNQTKAEAWSVFAALKLPKGAVEIGTGREATAAMDKRRTHIDGKAIRGQAGLAEYVSITWLTPAFDRLFTDGASDRRKFLDRLVFGLDPVHADRLSVYEKSLRERRQILEQPSYDSAWLEAIEESLACQGAAIAEARSHLINRLNEVMSARPGHFPAAVLGLQGGIDEQVAAHGKDRAQEWLRARLAQNRALDAEIGNAKYGPHRSDMLASYAAKNQPAPLCSTGEQKALLLSIILAHAKLIRDIRGAAPIVLFDEVAAHLDEQRRWALCQEITALHMQAWLTGTDADLFAGLKNQAQFLSLQSGIIES